MKFHQIYEDVLQLINDLPLSSPILTSHFLRWEGVYSLIAMAMTEKRQESEIHKNVLMFQVLLASIVVRKLG